MLIADYLAFEDRLVVTGAEADLRELARALEACDQEAIRCLGDQNPASTQIELEKDLVTFSLGRTRGVEASGDRELVAATARQLVAMTSYSMLELGSGEEAPSPPQTSLVLRRIDTKEEPRVDYRRTAEGGSWEAELKHEIPGRAALLMIWGTLLAWGGGSSLGCEPWACLSAVASGERLATTDHADIQQVVMIGIEWARQQLEFSSRLPFHMHYGDAHDRALIWIEGESTCVIVPEHHCQTGSVNWDFRNFVSYRRLLRSLVTHLRADSLTWAVDYENRDPIPPADLDDLAGLWRIFRRSGTTSPMPESHFMEEMRKELAGPSGDI